MVEPNWDGMSDQSFEARVAAVRSTDPKHGPLEYLPLYRPDLSGNEKAYVLHCLETGWISSLGEFVAQFERNMAAALGVRHAVAVTNGTVALHLAIHCLGIGPGDEVIVPTFSYIACVNTIAQVGATPVFVDCNEHDWLLNVAHVERKITPRTKAIMAVHLYGAICDMDTIRQLATAHDLFVIEDCAEALGATVHGRPCGSLGDVATFSFFGNKTLSTGEGGLVTTDDDDLADRLRLVKGQGQSRTRRYWHEQLGFNYRMTNICAAIGVAQLERLDSTLARKRAISARYRQLLSHLPVTMPVPNPGVNSSEWLFSFLLPEGCNRDTFMQHLHSNGIETRPVFYCAHHMPMYNEAVRYPVAELISALGISLPSYPALTGDQQIRVADAVSQAIRG